MSRHPRSFELVLASLMSEADGAARLIERSGTGVHDLTAMRDEEEAAGFWSPPSLSYFEARLQPTGIDSTFAVPVAVTPGTQRHRFALTMWPAFDLGVLAGPDGVPFYPHFVRRAGAEPVLPADVRAVQPWSATLEEVVARFGPPMDESGWDLRRWVTYEIDREKWIATFDLGLVQSVQPLRPHTDTE